MNSEFLDSYPYFVAYQINGDPYSSCLWVDTGYYFGPFPCRQAAQEWIDQQDIGQHERYELRLLTPPSV